MMKKIFLAPLSLLASLRVGAKAPLTTFAKGGGLLAAVLVPSYPLVNPSCLRRQASTNILSLAPLSLLASLRVGAKAPLTTFAKGGGLLAAVLVPSYPLVNPSCLRRQASTNILSLAPLSLLASLRVGTKCLSLSLAKGLGLLSSLPVTRTTHPSSCLRRQASTQPSYPVCKEQARCS